MQPLGFTSLVTEVVVGTIISLIGAPHILQDHALTPLLQPQRPLRPLKLRDENLPPTVALPGKTLHQRNKSSPALSSLAKVGALAQQPRRAAFADVSNTLRPQYVARDDSAIGAKSKLSIVKETVAALEEIKPKPAPAQRPAQRPLSVSGIKGFISQFTSSAAPTVAPASKVVAEEPKPYQQDAALPLKRPQPTRASTVVYREAYQEEQLATNPPNVGPAKAASANIAKALTQTTRRFTTSAAQAPATLLPELKSILPEDELRPLSASSSTYVDSHSDSAQRSSSGGVELFQPQFHGTANFETYEDASAQANIHNELLPSLVELDELLQDKVPPPSSADEQARQIAPPAGEKWDYLYDDVEDDDGYTTARSLKSHGDYTTGPMTTVLAPRMTARVERELAAAKHFVLMSKETSELEEDEAWDTSMVAEYGEEIFEYMRKLEVSSSKPPDFAVAGTDPQIRTECFPMRTTWTIKPKFSGRCDLSSWTGLFKSITASGFCPRHFSFVSITLIASSHAKWCRWASSSWLERRPYSLPQSTKRSTAPRCKRLSTWSTADIPSTRFSRPSASC